MNQIDAQHLLSRARAGEVRALARAISIVENREEGRAQLLWAAQQAYGTAFRIGLTGAPGSGKSSLSDALIEVLRNEGRRVAVLAVDPSSPFTGGALLGDRVRMSRHAEDDGVFIRSMSSRGALGGLSRAAWETLLLFDAASFDVVLVETVGVGQSELEVRDVCDLPSCQPRSGDIVQMMKAGIMEIADLFVINKADLPGADRMMAAVRELIQISSTNHGVRPNLLKSIAVQGEGISILWKTLWERYQMMQTDQTLQQKRKQQWAAHVRKAAEEELLRRFQEFLERNKQLLRWTEARDEERSSFDTTIQTLVDAFIHSSTP
ncbi:MAG: methylmalonyl Co-A mutase-associated GTPase MeaB [Firmicutes bacterium]|nr:methylmalonyl Co-A mutase-associated GTPase MeaB [Bacillota bacterium]